MQNINIISFILRGVKNIIAFANHVTPLSPAIDWDPNDTYSQDNMDPTIGSFFGVLPTDLVHHIFWMFFLQENQEAMRSFFLVSILNSRAQRRHVEWI